jgi:non-ribosomal peptide synthetase component F
MTNQNLINRLTAEEYRRVTYEWNDTAAPFSSHLCAHQLFEEQVAVTPEATAVVLEDRQLS